MFQSLRQHQYSDVNVVAIQHALQQTGLKAHAEWPQHSHHCT
ncbi:plasmid segregation protein ParM, partial [Shigella sonnei]|nr:plasmid segregation protein ParM [Shigella sonnei]